MKEISTRYSHFTQFGYHSDATESLQRQALYFLLRTLLLENLTSSMSQDGAPKGPSISAQLLKPKEDFVDNVDNDTTRNQILQPTANSSRQLEKIAIHNIAISKPTFTARVTKSYLTIHANEHISWF